MKSKEQIKILTIQGKEKHDYSLLYGTAVFSAETFLMRKSLRCGRKSPARSLDDPEDETFYDVECLTPDELAGRINDESFAHTEDYVRFINVSPDLLYPDRK